MMLITTKENVKSLLSINSPDNDSLINAIVLSISSAVENYMNRLVEAAERTQYFDVQSGQQVFNLGAFPVSACAAYNDYYRSFDTAIDTDLYTVLGDEGQLIVDQYELTAGAKTLKVVYTGGLAANQLVLQTAYPDIEMAARMQAAAMYEKRNKLNILSESFESGSISHQKFELLPIVRQILDKYRRMTIA